MISNGTQRGQVPPPLQVSTFNSFPVNQVQTFDISLAAYIKPNDLTITISNPTIGILDKQINWDQAINKCQVSFRAPIIGIYTISIDILNNPSGSFQFQTKAYDLSKVFINGSSGKCYFNEVYEFAVDASEAGEGQLEIAVNEGEIPNQVQVLDNGKCIVNFTPEECVPHTVDIKFNGHNVDGCPFVVEILPSKQIDNTEILAIPSLTKEERIIVNTKTVFILKNITSEQLEKNEIIVLDPDNQQVDYKLIEDLKSMQHIFEFTPKLVGDYIVKLRSGSRSKLPADIISEFPFPMKVFDSNKVIVSDVTDGVVCQPIFFFIDASQAGSGNLEIRVSSSTRNVPNYPQSEANAKIRVSFTPSEAVDHSIDVKFNGISVPNNPFKVRVSQFPQSRLPVQSRDLLECAAVDETLSFYVDYIGTRENRNIASDELTPESCQVQVLGPDFICSRVESIKLEKGTDKSTKQARFRVNFKPTKIGPHKMFFIVNNELMPANPITCNVYNINEVHVLFDNHIDQSSERVGKINQPFTFTVDASRAGEGTLALAVVSNITRTPVQTDVKVSEKGHGLYNLTFVPTEFAPHSIDMSFNDRIVPGSPFSVEILDENGKTYSQKVVSKAANKGTRTNGHSERSAGENQQDQLVENMENLHMKTATTGTSTSKSNKGKNSQASKEDEILQNIVVHGISLTRSPVNTTGNFIIETNRLAQAHDFDVIITDPSNSLVVVQCYLREDGNLLAEWMPRRVGTHKIEVLYKNRPVPDSPFITEAFNPSSVIIEPQKSTVFSVNDEITIKLNRKEAGIADLDVAITSPTGRDLPIDIKPIENGETISFKPISAGNYRLSVSFGGYEVPKSPLAFTVCEKKDSIKVSGSGLRCAEVNRSTQFNVETLCDGQLKVRIECGDREIVPKLEKQGKVYQVKYKPTEIGYATISLYWNGTHIEGSPHTVPVNDLGKILFRDANNKQASGMAQMTIDFEPKKPKEIIVDTKKCGPGDLKAEAYCRANPEIKFPLPISRNSTNGLYKITFSCPPESNHLPKELLSKDFPAEATYLIRCYYNNLAVPETLASVILSPSGTNQSRHLSTNKEKYQDEFDSRKTLENNNNNLKPKVTQQDVDCPIVALRGHGLVDAKCGVKSEFTIDGTKAGPGKPEVRFSGSNEDIQVKLEKIGEKLYVANYIASLAGTYTMNVLWNGKQVAGCPVTINVTGGCDPSRVICTADSLKGAVLGEEIKTFIDTRKAGPGELTAICTGPNKVAFCELLDRGDGTFILYIKPQESGKHTLTVKYGGELIPKSPFVIKVSGQPDPTKVRVYGPGVEHGVLSLYQSRFVCDTRGAGAGQLTVRIRGPKGAFRMETQRESQRDRTILCKYDPTEPGDYRIEIKWSGRHVPGSPFSVMIFDTQEELNRFIIGQKSNIAHNSNSLMQNHVPYTATMADYGQYSTMAAHTTQQPPFRLQ